MFAARALLTWSSTARISVDPNLCDLASVEWTAPSPATSPPTGRYLAQPLTAPCLSVKRTCQLFGSAACTCRPSRVRSFMSGRYSRRALPRTLCTRFSSCWCLLKFVVTLRSATLVCSISGARITKRSFSDLLNAPYPVFCDPRGFVATLLPSRKCVYKKCHGFLVFFILLSRDPLKASNF